MSLVVRRPLHALLAVAGTAAAACSTGMAPTPSGAPAPMAMMVAAPSPDPRVGLKAGLFDAGEAAWNLKLVSSTKPSEKFLGVTNSDLAFTGKYAIQGNYNGWQIWDISNPAAPTLVTAFYCPASQSDVSVYRNLLFISGEGTSGRLDCGGQGVRDTVSKDRLRGLRVFDITDIAHPRNVANVQTCRGSHTHSVLVDPKDPENVYVYISGSAGVRSPSELPGCVSATPDKDPASALFRIEVIKVPLAHPEQAAIVSSPRIFNDLTDPGHHKEAPEDIAASKKRAAEARARGLFTVTIDDNEFPVPPGFTAPLLDSIVAARKGTGTPTAADSAALRASLQGIIEKRFGIGGGEPGKPKPGPTQCHDITLYPAIGFAGGACEGYGLLLDIKDPSHPVRVAAVKDTNFSYWHSATFNNDGTKVIFTDEWGGGGAPKCRVTDRKEWGADAIFTLTGTSLGFKSYYKMPAAQTEQENCVAHNGSLIPIPGRDVMVQAWYQGGISIFDFTDASHPQEIAFFDRGPVNPARMDMGGSWSVYWYNGVIVSSEIARGLDIFDLQPSAYLTQNEIDAAKSVRLDYLNAQGQPKITWPATPALAKAYADQLERSRGLDGASLSAVRSAVDKAQQDPGAKAALATMAGRIEAAAASSTDGAKVAKLAATLRALSN